jgi:hypothetical protein
MTTIDIGKINDGVLRTGPWFLFTLMRPNRMEARQAHHSDYLEAMHATSEEMAQCRRAKLEGKCQICSSLIH